MPCARPHGGPGRTASARPGTRDGDFVTNDRYFVAVGRKPGVTAEETRAKLLEAAAAAFAEQGYDGARVGEIARRAGLSTGAIYAHYPTKAALLVEALRTHSPDELSELLDRGDTDDLLAALRTAGQELGDQDPTAGSLVLEALVAGRRDPEVAPSAQPGRRPPRAPLHPRPAPHAGGRAGRRHPRPRGRGPHPHDAGRRRAGAGRPGPRRRRRRRLVGPDRPPGGGAGPAGRAARHRLSRTTRTTRPRRRPGGPDDRHRAPPELRRADRDGACGLRRGRPHDRAQQRRADDLGLRAQPPGAGEAVREGQDVAVERHHRPPVGHRRRPREARPRAGGGRHARFQPAAGRRATRRSASWGEREWNRSPSRCRRGRCRSSSTASRARWSAPA